MSSNEQEDKISKTTNSPNLNGWLRLWIVISSIWAIGVALYSTISWLDDSLNYLRNKSEHILITAALIAVPPILILILGKSIAWIIKGFKL
jgi:hypothetical protein